MNWMKEREERTAMAAQDCSITDKKEDMNVTAISTILDNMRSERDSPFTRIEYNQANAKEVLREHAASFVADLIDKFNQMEIEQITFAPLVVTEIAWIYGQIARDEAAKQKISIFRDLGRLFNLERAEYNDWLSQFLDYRRRKKIVTEAERVMGDYGRDFQILYFCCSQELKRVAPEYYYEEIRTNAIVAIEIVGLVGLINRLNDQLRASRLGYREDTILNPYTNWLGENMELYAGVDTKAYNYRDEQTTRSLVVIRRRLAQHDFDLLH